MVIPLQAPEMDVRNKTPVLILLFTFINCLSGLNVTQLEEIMVDIWDGEVIVRWKHPELAPADTKYNIELMRYVGGNNWTEVPSCTGITRTYCDLSSLINDYRASYKVRVKLLTGNKLLSWKHKRFTPNYSKLRPPSFNLWATSSTLKIYIHQKPILKELFPFGVRYIIYLEERGQNNKTTTGYLEDEVDYDKREITFKSLQWGEEYCVSIKAEGKGAESSSSKSPKQCLLLPEQEWFIMAVSSLSIMGVLAFIAIVAIVLLCYLRRPEKTPIALKSPVSGWLPLTIGEGTMEVVTDKGWFLSSYRTELKNCVKVPVTHITVTEDNEEDRRTSMDSGVGMDSNSATNCGGSPPMRQEDSGCGSLGGPESSTSSQTDYPLHKEQTNTDIAKKEEDSGVGLSCQLNTLSMNLNGQDSGSLNEAVSQGNYHSQSPSVQIHVCDEEEDLKQMLPEPVLAEVVTGYRAGPQLCICSGSGLCAWCHKQDQHGTGVVKQYRAMCIENGLLGSNSDFMDPYKAGVTFSSYSKKTQMDTVMNDFETTFTQLGDTFPWLTALTSLPPLEGGQDFNMNNVSLSLCDVQLTTD